LIKPKEIFSEMRNNQAQGQAGNIYKTEIENETILRTDASALQVLFPYVKRLLLLFPGLKRKTNRALSQQEIRNNVYRIGTKHYREPFQ
jgi:hypothetical protein